MDESPNTSLFSANRLKFWIGGLLILAAVVYLIVSSTQASAQYFLTVNELLVQKNAGAERSVRVSGAVLGDTIHYDPQTLNLTFTIAHVPGSNRELEAQGGLAAALHAAVNDPQRARLEVVYHGAKPDLLQGEAQAILTGKMGQDGKFYASEILLKCPSRYEEALPGQTQK